MLMANWSHGLGFTQCTSAGAARQKKTYLLRDAMQTACQS